MRSSPYRPSLVGEMSTGLCWSHASHLAGALDQLSVAGPFRRFIIHQNLAGFYPDPETQRGPSSI